MQRYKVTESIIKGDAKQFEIELSKFDRPLTGSGLDTEHLSLIIYRNDIQFLCIYIDFLAKHKVQLYASDAIRILIETDKWEMLKLLRERDDVFGLSWFRCTLFRSNNDHAIEKGLEHKIISEFDVDWYVKTIKQHTDMSPKVYKELCKMHPEIYDPNFYIKLLQRAQRFSSEFELELMDLSKTPEDYKFLLELHITIPLYNFLVQKVPKKTIIERLIGKTTFYYFHEDLIDIIGIRDILQAKIDAAQAKLQESGDLKAKVIEPFCSDLLCYSKLNFRKMVMMQNIMRFDSNYRHVLKHLPPDYFTDAEKSYFMVECLTNKAEDVADHLSHMGWKIYDSPENQAKCVNQIDQYNKIPKH